MDVGIEDAEDILLVDDNPGDIRLIEEAFAASPLNPTIHTSTTRDDALDFLKQRGDYEAVPTPDLLLLDWNLSQYTGNAVIRAAKAETPEIPVVVMTGSKPSLQRIESSTPAPDEYIEKQTDLQQYIDVLRSCGTD